MTVKIRLARFGCKHRPFYRVVAANDKSRRDGKDEDAQRISLKFDRIKYWLSVGAQPTDTVENMLFRAGLIPPKSMVVMKNGSTDKHVSPITGEILN
ncbi:unnamed protein product [Arabis nemorensis]|uniref:Ribosomal protein S16 n=1 Tax=Arabis nemorensis TaxID=586526 RepID=A0A565C9V9_9BRAS|nr:unnamed protein product [Arabis nemorensis]